MEGRGGWKDHGDGSGARVLEAESKDTKLHSSRVGVRRVGRSGNH